MAYCTIEDVQSSLGEDKLIELTDDEDTGEVNEDNLDSCIASADRIIDGYCQSRYTVPFTDPVPALITELSINLTIAKLFARKRQQDDVIKDLERDQKALLAKINAGDIQIGISTDSPIAPVSTAKLTARTKIFDSTKMDQY